MWSLGLCLLVGVNFTWENIWCEHRQNRHIKQMVPYFHNLEATAYTICELFDE